MSADPASAVLHDRIALTAPSEVGSNALICALVPSVVRAGVLALGHDGHAVAAECADQFTRHAVHGGFAVDDGRTWVRPQIHLYGRAPLADLIACAGPSGVAAYLTAADHGGVWLRLHTADGAVITEESGLGALRARLATGRPALPVNAMCIGMIIDHRQERT